MIVSKIVPVKISFITMVWLTIGMRFKPLVKLMFRILKNIGMQVIRLIGVRALWASLKVLVKLAIAIHRPDMNSV